MSLDAALDRPSWIPSFSLRDSLTVMVGLAIAFSTWSSPGGDWIDIPVTLLSFYFIISLFREAIYLWQLLSQSSDATGHERWGLRILLLVRIFTAVGIIVATFLRLLAANQKLSLVDFLVSGLFVQLPFLPRDLIIALWLAAIGLPRFAAQSAAKPKSRHALFAALALAGGLIAIVCYWIEQMVILGLVYIAIQGVQNWQPPKLLPPEMNVSADVYLHRFAVASLVGTGSIILNLCLLGALVACWNRRWLRFFLGITFLMGTALQSAIAYWIATKGARQLSPYMAESVQPWAWSTILIVAALVMLASMIIALRWLGRSFIATESGAEVTLPKLYFHERGSAALLVTLIAFVGLFGHAITEYVTLLHQRLFKGPFTWDMLMYYLRMNPANLIWIATIIGGAIIAWQRRSPVKPRSLSLYTIDPVEFAVVIFGIMFLLVSSAPILGAASFIGTFVRVGHKI